MQNKHQEHFEDLTLTGDFRGLNAILSSFSLSTKIDGSPSLVFGTNPATNKFFLGTKSVFNQIKIKIAHSHEEIDAFYSNEVAEILHACFDVLPRTPKILQGDFIGFSGKQEYTPNTITYKFSEVISEKILISVHTEWATESELKNAYVVGSAPKISHTKFVKFIPTEAQLIVDTDDFQEVIGFLKQCATTVTFATEKEAKEIKKQINSCIRENRPINPEDFSNSNLISLWKLAESIKLDFLHFCRAINAPDSYIGYEQVNQEGFVLQNDEVILKFVDRYSFSRSNFLQQKSWQK